MTPEEKEARRNLVRYGMFLLVVLALVITPTALYLAAVSVTSLLMPTIIATALTIVVAVGVYMAYHRYLDRI